MRSTDNLKDSHILKLVKNILLLWLSDYHPLTNHKMEIYGDGEMDYWLRVLSAHSEDRFSFKHPHCCFGINGDEAYIIYLYTCRQNTHMNKIRLNMILKGKIQYHYD